MPHALLLLGRKVGPTNQFFGSTHKTSSGNCKGNGRLGMCLAVWRPRMAMKKEEARREVPSEYDSWVKKHPNQASMMGGFLFFRYLQAERSDLLDFRGGGNKWQIVHS
jgi:hypothetical protein